MWQNSAKKCSRQENSMGEISRDKPLEDLEAVLCGQNLDHELGVICDMSQAGEGRYPGVR